MSDDDEDVFKEYKEDTGLTLKIDATFWFILKILNYGNTFIGSYLLWVRNIKRRSTPRNALKSC